MLKRNCRHAQLLIALLFMVIMTRGQDAGTALEVSSLHAAIETHKTEVVKQMIGMGADVRTQIKGMNALHVACATGSVDLVKMVLEAGADPNSITEEGQGFTSLQGCTWGFTFQKSSKIAGVLLEKGADPNLAPNAYSYPIFYAIEGKDLALLDMLLENGARKDVLNPSGQKPMDVIVAHMTNPDTDVKSKETYMKMKISLSQ